MRDQAPQPTGIAINEAGNVLVGTSVGTIVFGLSPDEMRSFAARLVETADKIEASAASAASAAIARAGRLS